MDSKTNETKKYSTHLSIINLKQVIYQHQFIII